MCKVKPFYFLRMTKMGRPLVAFEKSTLMTVWYMSNTETFRYYKQKLLLLFTYLFSVTDNLTLCYYLHVITNIIFCNRNILSTYLAIQIFE